MQREEKAKQFLSVELCRSRPESVTDLRNRVRLPAGAQGFPLLRRLFPSAGGRNKRRKLPGEISACSTTWGIISHPAPLQEYRIWDFTASSCSCWWPSPPELVQIRELRHLSGWHWQHGTGSEVLHVCRGTLQTSPELCS